MINLNSHAQEILVTINNLIIGLHILLHYIFLYTYKGYSQLLDLYLLIRWIHLLLAIISHHSRQFGSIIRLFLGILGSLQSLLSSLWLDNFYDNMQFSSKNWLSMRIQLENHQVISNPLVLLECINYFTWSSSLIKVV